MNQMCRQHRSTVVVDRSKRATDFAGEIHSLVEPTAYASSEQTIKTAGPRVADRATQSSHLRNAPDTGSLGRTREIGRKTAASHHPRISRIRPLLMSGENVSVNIGTLRAGDSVTITFQVTVDNPPNLTLLNPPRVSNQGTVSGTNFRNMLTDDPDAVGASNPTDTPVDLFDTSTNLVSDLNPSNFAPRDLHGHGERDTHRARLIHRNRGLHRHV